MSNSKNSERLTLQSESLNNNIARTTIFNPESNYSIKQDILFFKNDVLRDIRRLEEKLNTKLTEQTVVNNQQYTACEKKLDLLSSRIIQVNTIVSDNELLNKKLNDFQIFKSKVEDNLLAINSRIYNIEKESKEEIIKLKKLLEDNLYYPGIIGKNCEFSNFRFFIDFVLNNFKILSNFKEKIQNYDLVEFKRKINSDLQEFRFIITDNYKNLRNLVEKFKKEYNNKLTELNNQYEIKFKNYDDKIKDFTNKINDYLHLYEQKFEDKYNTLENNWNDKFTEQINEINNLKNQFINDINKIKNSISKNEKSIGNLKKTTEKNILLMKISSANYKKSLLGKNKEYGYPLVMDNSFINKQILNDMIQNSEEKTNTDNITEYQTNFRMKKLNIIEHSKSFDESHNNETNIHNYDSAVQLRNTKENITLTQEEINNDGKRNNKISKMNLNKYNDYKKLVFQNNYSITNIPNIKIKKVVLPDNLNKRNKIMKISKSTVMKNKGKRIMSNNPSTHKKYFLQNSDNLTTNKNILNNLNNLNNYNVTKINKHQNSKKKNINFIESAKIFDHRPLSKNPKNLNLLSQIQSKNKNDISDSAGELKKDETRSLSFEKNKKGKNEKDEKIQIGFRKTFIANNQFKEFLLVNPKNPKKNRKIKM